MRWSCAVNQGSKPVEPGGLAEGLGIVVAFAQVGGHRGQAPGGGQLEGGGFGARGEVGEPAAEAVEADVQPAQGLVQRLAGRCGRWP